LVQRTLLAADRVASTSEAMAGQVQQVLGAHRLREPIAITPFGVDTAGFVPAPQPSTTPGRPLVIGTVKKLEPKYGIDTLIRAFALLQPEAGGTPPLLRLVGEGHQQAELQALAQALGVADRVRFVGAVPHAQVPATLQGFDVFAAASRLDSESFGVAVIEASACGLPVVVTRAGGLPEVVREGETGLIVEREDPPALANALRTLLADAALRQRLGQAGRAHVQARYEWAESVQRMVALYREVLQAHAPGGARPGLAR
jgi:L-malate glycosyltransferase